MTSDDSTMSEKATSTGTTDPKPITASDKPTRASSAVAADGSNKVAPPRRSARHVKNGPTTSGKDVTHVVKVTVLGLAGITVDRSKCRYSSEDEELPVSPSKMRAVVAFSRNSVIRGTTSLSKPLTKSPQEDLVLATTETHEVVTTTEHGEEVSNVAVLKSASGDDAATQTTKSTGGSTRAPPRRHLAVWTSEDRSLGSTVMFEVNLHRSDTGDPKQNATASSSTFAPKSFDLTIGLTEGHNSDQAAVALPLGVASLTISGDESSNEEGSTVDLPVWSLAQARPLGTSDGVGGYPLITLAPRQKAVADGIPLKKKRAGLQRLFSKKDKNGNIATSFPSSAERGAFSAAYSMDSTGDAILRVSLEVHEKSPEISASKETPMQRMKESKSRKIVSNRPGSPVVRKGQEIDSFDDETYDSDEDTEWTDDTEYTDEYTDYTGSIITAEDETITLDDSIVTTTDNRMVFFSWVNSPESPDNDSERKAGGRSSRFPLRHDSQLSLTVLGRQVWLPTCGSVDGHRSVSGDSREDLTHVTADFFGESYQIPVCRGIAKKEDDSTTTDSEQNRSSAGSTRILDIMNGVLCNSDGREKRPVKVASTFSTLSENARDSTPKHVFVINGVNNNSVEDSFLSDEAKVPRVPDEPSEIDDIMRIVRSKHPNRSRKDLVVMPQVKEEKRSPKAHKNSVADVSPKGVDGFVDIKRDVMTNPGDRILQSVSDIFQCNYPTASGIGPRYEPFEPQIPPVVIRSEADVMSVGELTATTHERNIASAEEASDARILERARQMLNETEQPEREENHKRIPVPTCSGNGICASLSRRDTTSSAIHLGREDTCSIIEGERSHHARSLHVPTPAVNDEDCTNFSPIEVEKVSSEEKGPTFSRVRNPSGDGKCKKDHLRESLYSASLPVYASMKGDESESIIGAYGESQSDDRELFNPVTGQEVEQAFI